MTNGELTNGELTIARVNTAGGEVYECGATGSCAFDSFRFSAIRTGLAALVIGLTSSDIRAGVVAEIAADWSRYGPFIPTNQHATYLSTMALPGTYAGNHELHALSRLYRVAIKVWGATQAHDVTIRADTVGTDAPTVHLARRDAGDFRDHYWAVIFPPHEVGSPIVPPTLACVQRMRVASPFP